MMTRLKRKTDGKCFDCTIFLDGRDLMAVYWDGHDWACGRLDSFEPAVSGIDY